MKENEFPILKITSIDWDKDHEEFEKLPKELDIIALGGFLVLTWGAWSATITLLIISSIDVLMRTQWKWIALEKLLELKRLL